jgi:hypothetical protein
VTEMTHERIDVVQWGGAPASRYSGGTGTHPPFVTETILFASRARCRLIDTTFGSTPTSSATSSVVTKCARVR